MKGGAQTTIGTAGKIFSDDWQRRPTGAAKPAAPAKGALSALPPKAPARPTTTTTRTSTQRQ